MPSRDPRSFRFTSALIEALADRARLRGETQTALAERYLQEGLRREEHPLITFREGAAGRRPTLVGTRLDVAQVIDTLRASDNSISDAAAYLEIPEAHVRACVSYYAAYADEVDEWRKRVDEIAAREEEAWKREQAVLA